MPVHLSNLTSTSVEVYWYLDTSSSLPPIPSGYKVRYRKKRFLALWHPMGPYEGPGPDYLMLGTPISGLKPKTEYRFQVMVSYNYSAPFFYSVFGTIDATTLP